MSTLITAQTKGNAVLYGYKQAVLPGANPRVISEETGEVENVMKKANYNYFFYMSSTARLYPSEIWIDGEGHSVKVETVKKTPVEIINSNTPLSPKKTTLVPKTTRRVIQLTPTPQISGKKMLKVKNLSRTHELVVVYKMNGKFYYQTMKKLIVLEAAAMQ